MYLCTNRNCPNKRFSYEEKILSGLFLTFPQKLKISGERGNVEKSSFKTLKTYADRENLC